MKILRVPYDKTLLEGMIFHYYFPDTVSHPFKYSAAGSTDLITGEIINTPPDCDSSEGWTHIVIYELPDLQAISTSIANVVGFETDLTVAGGELAMFKTMYLCMYDNCPHVYVTLPSLHSKSSVAYGDVFITGFCNSEVFDDIFDETKLETSAVYANQEEYDSVLLHDKLKFNILGIQTVKRLRKSLADVIEVLKAV